MAADSLTARGAKKRQELVEAAAEILRESGPASVSMRNVARRGSASLSAMTYYFANADELLEDAGRVNIGLWAERAEKVAERAEVNGPPEGRQASIDLVLSATLPSQSPLLGHYLQLVAAGEAAPVARAYATGRGRLNQAVGRVLAVAGIDLPAEVIIAVVDGGAVTALSEGRDVQTTARALLEQLLSVCVGPPEGEAARG